MENICRDCSDPAEPGSSRCKPCFRRHLHGIRIAPSATPSRNAQVAKLNDKEKEWDRDIAAYKELRRQGLQPRQIDGSADLAARANTGLEVERGAVLADEKLAKRADTAQKELKEAGIV